MQNTVIRQTFLILASLLAAVACGPGVDDPAYDYDEAPRESSDNVALKTATVWPDIDVYQDVNGVFSPTGVTAHNGQKVIWHLYSHRQGIVPSTSTTGAWPGVCTAKGYGTTPNNEFTGPMPRGHSGVFVLGSFGQGYEEYPNGSPSITTHPTTGLKMCPSGAEANSLNINTPNVGPYLCPESDTAYYQKTRDATWQDVDLRGVTIRLNWKDIQPTKTGAYNWTILEREVGKAVTYSKKYSVVIKAGEDGTPDWIFNTRPPIAGAPNVPGATRSGAQWGQVPRVVVDGNEEESNVDCRWISLGLPSNRHYKTYYNAMITSLANKLKSNADWYRRLAYIKPSGGNAESAEMRLPNGCNSVAGQGCGGIPSCNNKTWRDNGYTPDGMYAWLADQSSHIDSNFPNKTMSYQVIQAGWPMANFKKSARFVGPGTWRGDSGGTCAPASPAKVIPASATARGPTTTARFTIVARRRPPTQRRGGKAIMFKSVIAKRTRAYGYWGLMQFYRFSAHCRLYSLAARCFVWVQPYRMDARCCVKVVPIMRVQSQNERGSGSRLTIGPTKEMRVVTVRSLRSRCCTRPVRQVCVMDIMMISGRDFFYAPTGILS